MKPVNKILLSNILLPVAAVLLTLATQVQIGLQPHWHPYLFLIFLATVFEYNRHRIKDILNESRNQSSEEFMWVSKNKWKIVGLCIVWIISLFVTIYFTNTKVLLALLPLGIATVFYSVPVKGINSVFFRLREIPYLKIFLISFVWTASTTLLPIIQLDLKILNFQFVLLFTERFLFIFAVAIHFDIRDMQKDKIAGLKTIPLLFNQKNAMWLSYFSLLLCFIVAYFHYQFQHSGFILVALSISSVTTFLLFKSEYVKKRGSFYYQVLDGMLLLQGLLVLTFYYFNHF